MKKITLILILLCFSTLLSFPSSSAAINQKSAYWIYSTPDGLTNETTNEYTLIESQGVTYNVSVSHTPYNYTIPETNTSVNVQQSWYYHATTGVLIGKSQNITYYKNNTFTRSDLADFRYSVISLEMGTNVTFLANSTAYYANSTVTKIGKWVMVFNVTDISNEQVVVGNRTVNTTKFVARSIVNHLTYIQTNVTVYPSPRVYEGNLSNETQRIVRHSLYAEPSSSLQLDSIRLDNNGIDQLKTLVDFYIPPTNVDQSNKNTESTETTPFFLFSSLLLLPVLAKKSKN